MVRISLVLALSLVSASAADWYVRDGASGSGTSWSDAFDQLSSAESAAARGDTIWVATGTYAAVTFNTANSGSTYIYVKRATVSAHGTDTGWNDSYDGVATMTMPWVIVSDYWDISGVTWKGFATTGTTLSQGSDGSFEQGLIVVEGDEVKLRYLNMTYNYESSNFNIVWEGLNPTLDHIYWYKAVGEDQLFFDNTHGTLSTLRMSNCYATMPSPPDDGGHRDFCNPYTSSAAYAIELVNCVWENHEGLGWIFLLQDNEQVDHIYVTNCVFSSLEADAIRLGGGNGGCASVVCVNTVFNNCSDFDGFGATPSTLRNNIYLGAGYAGADVNKIGTPQYSLFIGADAGYTAATGNINASGDTGGDHFVNIADADGVDNTIFTADDGFMLLTGTDGVDAGTTATITDIRNYSRDGSPDMGAYEFGATGGEPEAPAPFSTNGLWNIGTVTF